MIYPTRRAIILAAVGAPVSLFVGLIAPGYWMAVGAWLTLVGGLILVDALVGPSRAAATVGVEAPVVLGMGAQTTAVLRAAFDRAPPRQAQITVETNARLMLAPGPATVTFAGKTAEADVTLASVRRGEGEISTLWLRWQGVLGLVWKQVRETPGRVVIIGPDVQAVKTRAMILFARDAQHGVKLQRDTGEGSEFHALREVDGATDPRVIDWKQSARHGALLGKEFRTDRNHPVVLAIDTGRAMCEPLLGQPRVDRAINAALLLAYVSLKTGDPAGVFGFDARPRGFSGIVSGPAAFPRLQRQLAALDYSPEETNYTLGLTQLGVSLRRRSLVVVFTDFADSTTAELMVENLTRLLRRHVVLFVVMRDEELEAIARAEPTDAPAVSRAVTARALLKSRDVVIARLARLGVHVVDAPALSIESALIGAYLDLKRRDLL